MHGAMVLGDWVMALGLLEEQAPDGRTLKYATRGSIGHVIALRPGFFPTIYWESAKKVCDCPCDELVLLCGAGGPENAAGGRGRSRSGGRS